MAATWLGSCWICRIGWSWPRIAGEVWPWPRLCPACGERLRRIEPPSLWVGRVEPYGPLPAAKPEKAGPETRGRPKRAIRQTRAAQAVVALRSGPLTTTQIAERLTCGLQAAHAAANDARLGGLVERRGRDGRCVLWAIAPQCSTPPPEPSDAEDPDGS